MPDIQNCPAPANDFVLTTVIPFTLLDCMVELPLVLKAHLKSRKGKVNFPIDASKLKVHSRTLKTQATKPLRQHEQHRKNRLHRRARCIQNVWKHRGEPRNARKALERTCHRFNSTHRRGRDVVVDEALPGVGVLVEQVGAAQLKGELRHVHEVKVVARGELAQRELGTRNEHVAREPNERPPRKRRSPTMAHNTRARMRRATVGHEQVHGSRSQAETRHEVFQLNGTGYPTAVEPRASRPVEELGKKLATRPDDLKRRYVAQADVHVGRLAHACRRSLAIDKKDPRRQTQTLQKSNRIWPHPRTLCQSPC